MDRRGVTLVELMVAVTFLSVVAISSALVYSTTIRALSISKGNSTAVRLAQDKFETLQGLSYPLLIVTPQTDLNTSPGVDLTNYPPESFNMSGKTFTRSTIISYVYRDAAGNITVLTPDASDTGLKQIKVLIKYLQGSTTTTKTYTILVANPNVSATNAIVYGLVTDTAGVAIANAQVFVTQNQNWSALASTTGYYQIPTDTATYTITALKAGFWDKQSASLNPLGPTQADMQLTRRSTGRVTGIVTARESYLLISGIYAGLTDATTQFIELYNPTTYQIMIASNATSQMLNIINCGNGNDVYPRVYSVEGSGAGFPLYIPSQGYFLISTTSPTINGVLPDAVFPNILANQNGLAVSNPIKHVNKGGLAVQDSYGVKMDSVSWNTGSGGATDCLEGSPVVVDNGAGGYGSGGIILRKTSPSGYAGTYGSSFDSGNNADDLALNPTGAPTWPRNRTTLMNAAYGIPASSASLSVTDGFSAGATASSTGYFLLNGVSTGAWSLSAYWTSYSSITGGSLQVNAGATTSLDLLLEPAPSGQGGLAGKVSRADTLAPLSQIKIIIGSLSALTDSAGNYTLNLTSGAYTIQANSPTNLASYNYGYDTVTATAAVTAGAMLSGINFNLNPAFYVTGKVTTNGTAAYPDVGVKAVSQGLEVATALSDSAGAFQLYGIPLTAVATVTPILNPGAQASAPALLTHSAPPQGQDAGPDNFTVTSSQGIISGTVKDAATPITTGVLLVATTAALAALPLVDNAYATGPNVLYGTISDSSGNYSITVVKNTTYTVYGYYVKLQGTSATTTSAASQSVYISSNVTVNMAW